MHRFLWLEPKRGRLIFRYDVVANGANVTAVLRLVQGCACDGKAGSLKSARQRKRELPIDRPA